LSSANVFGIELVVRNGMLELAGFPSFFCRKSGVSRDSDVAPDGAPWGAGSAGGQRLGHRATGFIYTGEGWDQPPV